MSNISKRRKEGSKAKIKSMGDHQEFLKRITKTLYYGQLPSLPCISLPVTEVSCSVWSEWQRGRSVRRLHADAAAGISRGAGVSPAALVLALLYLERLRAARPHYLAQTPPADLFLVTLMVGNKFLQDDGEDDEVICSEWAASGGMEIDQLKRLELEFLSAIDWNVFVSEKSFEAGLQWLERRVALKQALARGYFTYTELSCSCELAAAGLAAALAAGAALAGLLALLAGALLAPLEGALLAPLEGALLAPLEGALLAPPAAPAPAASPANIITHSLSFPLPATDSVLNSTLNLSTVPAIEVESPTIDKIRCCSKWLKHKESLAKKNWYDSIVVYDWKSFEPWWSKTSILNWLYRSSLVDPMQRWLERINEYADLFKRELPTESPSLMNHCREYDNIERAIEQPDEHKCVHQWLNLSKLSALIVSISDR